MSCRSKNEKGKHSKRGRVVFQINGNFFKGWRKYTPRIKFAGALVIPGAATGISYPSGQANRGLR